MIVQVEHLDAILDLQKLVKISAAGLSKMLDDARQHVNILLVVDMRIFWFAFWKELCFTSYEKSGMTLIGTTCQNCLKCMIFGHR